MGTTVITKKQPVKRTNAANKKTKPAGKNQNNYAASSSSLVITNKANNYPWLVQAAKIDKPNNQLNAADINGLTEGKITKELLSQNPTLKGKADAILAAMLEEGYIDKDGNIQPKLEKLLSANLNKDTFKFKNLDLNEKNKKELSTLFNFLKNVSNNSVQKFVNGLVGEFANKKTTFDVTKRQTLINIINQAQVKPERRERIISELKSKGADLFAKEIEDKKTRYETRTLMPYHNVTVRPLQTSYDIDEDVVTAVSTKNKKVTAEQIVKLFQEKGKGIINKKDLPEKVQKDEKLMSALFDQSGEELTLKKDLTMEAALKIIDESALTDKEKVELDEVVKESDRTISYENLKDFLLTEAGWTEEAVAIIFGDKTTISRKEFVETLRFHEIAQWNRNCNDREFCERHGLKEHEVGRTFGESKNFLKFDMQEAKNAVAKLEKLEQEKKLPSDLLNKLKRFRGLQGDNKKFNEFELKVLYIRLALDKKDDIVTTDHVIDYNKFCVAYGLIDVEANPDKEIKLAEYTGSDADLEKNYSKWNGRQTNDDYFVPRDPATKNPIDENLQVDVYQFWVEKNYDPRKNNKKGGQYVNAVVEYYGKKYKCVVRDNHYKMPQSAKHHALRYKDGDKTKSEKIEYQSSAEKNKSGHNLNLLGIDQ